MVFRTREWKLDDEVGKALCIMTVVINTREITHLSCRELPLLSFSEVSQSTFTATKATQCLAIHLKTNEKRMRRRMRGKSKMTTVRTRKKREGQVGREAGRDRERQRRTVCTRTYAPCTQHLCPPHPLIPGS